MLTTINGLSDAKDFLFALPTEGGEPIEISFGKDDQLAAIRAQMAQHGWMAFMATNAMTVKLIYSPDTAYEVVFDKGGRPHHKRLVLVRSGIVAERGGKGPFTQYRVETGETLRCVKLGTIPNIGGDIQAAVKAMIAWITDTGLGEELAWQVFYGVGMNAKGLIKRCHDLIETYCANDKGQLVEVINGAWEAGDPLTEAGLPKACQFILDAGWRVQFDDTVVTYFRVFKQLIEPETEWRWLQAAPVAVKRAA
jgi:hypothetical protein